MGGFDVFGFAGYNPNEDFQNLATKIFFDMNELLPMVLAAQID